MDFVWLVYNKIIVTYHVCCAVNWICLFTRCIYFLIGIYEFPETRPTRIELERPQDAANQKTDTIKIVRFQTPVVYPRHIFIVCRVHFGFPGPDLVATDDRGYFWRRVHYSEFVGVESYFCIKMTKNVKNSARDVTLTSTYRRTVYFETSWIIFLSSLY